MNRTHRNNKDRYHITATAKLSWHKGNAKPHFSLTATGQDHGSEFGGCCHNEILKHWPDLKSLADLHLSDVDGTPMHALENGFYWLGGTHWQKPDFKVAANHFRISESEARNLVDKLFGNSFSHTAGFLSKQEAEKAKARLAEWIKTQKHRWLNEANTAIEQFNLIRPRAAA